MLDRTDDNIMGELLNSTCRFSFVPLYRNRWAPEQIWASMKRESWKHICFLPQAPTLLLFAKWAGPPASREVGEDRSVEASSSCSKQNRNHYTAN